MDSTHCRLCGEIIQQPRTGRKREFCRAAHRTAYCRRKKADEVTSVRSRHLVQATEQDWRRWERYGEPTASFLADIGVRYGREIANLIAKGIDMHTKAHAPKRRTPEPIESTIVEV